MISANELLFESQDGNPPLFKHQQELVSAFLSLKESPYYVPFENLIEYQKSQNRLKAYISQLLSGSVTRTVTEDFKNALQKAISSRTKSDVLAEEVYYKVITYLKHRNTLPSRQDKASIVTSSFKKDISNANYICIISSKPMNDEIESNSSDFSIRAFFIDDLINNLLHTSPARKVYRFNFPLESYCEIFWKGLEKELFKRFDALIDESENVIDNLYDKKIISSRSMTEYKTYLDSKDPAPGTLEKDLINKEEFLSRLITDIILSLNNTKTILTYLTTEPIYSIPLISTNPNDSKCQIYFLLEDEHKAQTLFKTSPDTILLWRIFVWDVLKSNSKSKEITYKL
jgi:hypothetical protein